MIPVVEDFVVVADSGLMNNFSLEKLDGVLYEHPKDDRRLLYPIQISGQRKIVITDKKG